MGKSIGEIIARGDGVMEGYWRQPDASAEALRGGWFHTGDMATLNEDGYLLIVDRKKDIIVSGGENISSLELEKAILAHPAVLEAGVIPVPDEKWGEVPIALVVLKPNAQPPRSPNSSNSAVRGLAHYKCPRIVRIRGQFAQNRHWENPEKRSPEKILARQGYDSPGASPRQQASRSPNRFDATKSSQTLVRHAKRESCSWI